jgi:hypothetical protein
MGTAKFSGPAPALNHAPSCRSALSSTWVENGVRAAGISRAPSRVSRGHWLICCILQGWQACRDALPGVRGWSARCVVVPQNGLCRIVEMHLPVPRTTIGQVVVVGRVKRLRETRGPPSPIRVSSGCESLTPRGTRYPPFPICKRLHAQALPSPRGRRGRVLPVLGAMHILQTLRIAQARCAATLPNPHHGGFSARPRHAALIVLAASLMLQRKLPSVLEGAGLSLPLPVAEDLDELRRHALDGLPSLRVRAPPLDAQLPRHAPEREGERGREREREREREDEHRHATRRTGAAALVPAQPDLRFVLEDALTQHRLHREQPVVEGGVRFVFLDFGQGPVPGRLRRPRGVGIATLDFRFNKIGDSGAEGLGWALAASSTLTTLRLGYCGITAAGAAHLAEGLSRSTSLATLELRGSKIGDSGAEVLSRVLAASSTLTTLHLVDCGITAAGAAHLAEGWGRSASLATLYLSETRSGTAGQRSWAGWGWGVIRYGGTPVCSWKSSWRWLGFKGQKLRQHAR